MQDYDIALELKYLKSIHIHSLFLSQKVKEILIWPKIEVHLNFDSNISLHKYAEFIEFYSVINSNNKVYLDLYTGFDLNLPN